jgi:hypothetical protein
MPISRALDGGLFPAGFVQGRQKSTETQARG